MKSGIFFIINLKIFINNFLGIPHERFGEAPRAYIVKSADSKITDVEITKFVAENAAPYKQLVKVFTIFFLHIYYFLFIL